jgi:hypothetical protein
MVKGRIEVRMYKARRQKLRQEQEPRWEDKVLELPKQILGTRIIRGNLSIKESIQEVA